MTLFGDSDPVTRGADKLLQMGIPGAKDQPHRVLQGAGHFIQEDKGEELGRLIVEFIRSAKGG